MFVDKFSDSSVLLVWMSIFSSAGNTKCNTVNVNLLKKWHTVGVTARAHAQCSPKKGFLAQFTQHIKQNLFDRLFKIDHLSFWSILEVLRYRYISNHSAV